MKDGRFWSLEVVGNPAKDQDFDFMIEPDDNGRSLKIHFDISATIDPRYYNGTIKIFNLAANKRNNLNFNLLLDDFGTGPSVKLRAGYENRSGLIFDGVVHRGYNIRQPESGNWITHLQVGLPFKQDLELIIEPITSGSIGAAQGLADYLTNAIRKVYTQKDRLSIKFASDFDRNLLSEINVFFDSGNTYNGSLGYFGNSISILDEIQRQFNLILVYDTNGLNVTGRKYAASSDNLRSPITIPDGTTVPELVISKKNGLIGSPEYTDTGAKIISYIRPELRIFQYIGVRSEVLNRDISIVELNHRGDTHTDEWYSEIDGSNFNQLIA